VLFPSSCRRGILTNGRAEGLIVVSIQELEDLHYFFNHCSEGMWSPPVDDMDEESWEAELRTLARRGAELSMELVRRAKTRPEGSLEYDVEIGGECMDLAV
jgi:hypothetical protein